jgi:adenine-specific DNA-methyltransferase
MSPRKRATKAGPTPVEALRHKDRRANIPTNELRGMLADDERAPKAMLYPRDSSLDPQLVWRGKDEQDAADLEVPVVPVYIQEKIQPRVIIENLRRTAVAGEPEPELTLFDDFNGIAFEQLVDFYQHEQNWANRLILGDSLLVMTSLAEKEGLKGKVQTIYLDPPYGIKFGSNWQVSTRRRDVKDGKLQDATRQPEQIRAFRDTWELGIHSYLAYLRDRLRVAHELLNESGSIFVQIGDENVHLVRSLLDEVFGSENYVAEIAFKKTSGAGSPSGGTQTLALIHDYILWYARSRESLKYRTIFRQREIGGQGGGQYSWIEEEGARRRATTEELSAGAIPGRWLRPSPMTSSTVREAQTTVFPVDLNGDVYVPPAGGWKTNQDGMRRLGWADRLMGIGKTLCYVRYFEDFPAYPYNSVWEDTVISGFGEQRVYVVQTNLKVVERCLLMSSDPGDLVLDPTCGSGTTAVAAEKWGRRWITVDTSRVALALTRTRLMAYRYPWYELRDESDVRQGFSAELCHESR